MVQPSEWSKNVKRNSFWIYLFFSDKMSSLYVQCLKSRVEKAWKEEMANNHTKVERLHTEKRDHVPVPHHYRKRACHNADCVQVNGSNTKLISLFYTVLMILLTCIIKAISLIFEI